MLVRLSITPRYQSGVKVKVGLVYRTAEQIQAKWPQFKHYCCYMFYDQVSSRFE